MLRTRGGALCSLVLSFNNDGPQGSWFRYICNDGTYLARYDDLMDGHGGTVRTGIAAPGLELQDREFVDAVRTGRQPAVSVTDVLPTYRTLGVLAAALENVGHPAPEVGT